MTIYVLVDEMNYDGGGAPISVHSSKEAAFARVAFLKEEKRLRVADLNLPKGHPWLRPSCFDILEFEVED